MKMDVLYELDMLYERWLLEDCPEDIGCKDDLVTKFESNFRRDEFNEIVKRCIQWLKIM